MMLLERIQTTFSGWEIPNLMLKTPSWAKEVSQIIKDSGAYQAVAKNSRTIKYLAEITGIACAIVYIAHIYLKIQKAQVELSKKIEGYQQKQDQLEASLMQFRTIFEEEEKIRKKIENQPEGSSSTAEIAPNTIQTQFQELEERVTRMQKRVEAYHEIQEQLSTNLQNEKKNQQEASKSLELHLKTTETNLNNIKTHLEQIEAQICRTREEENLSLDILINQNTEKHIAETY